MDAVYDARIQRCHDAVFDDVTVGEADSALWDPDDNGLRNLRSDDESDGELGPELDCSYL